MLCLIVLFGAVGCNKEDKKQEENQNQNQDILNKTSGKCTLKECMDQISGTSKVEDVNKIIGFDGSLIKNDTKSKTYSWKLSDDITIEGLFYTYTSTITAVVDKKIISNDKIDFSKYTSDIQPKVKGGITYDEFVKSFGNVEGFIVEKTSTSTKYTWAKSDGTYITGSFMNSDKKCSFVSGRV